MNPPEEMLGSLLGNPELMQQLMSMAQSLNLQPGPAAREEPAPGLDPALLQGLTRFAGQMRPDPQQQALLSALGPYLSQSRVAKLERAMGAARLAGAASSLLGSGILSLSGGR